MSAGRLSPVCRGDGRRPARIHGARWHSSSFVRRTAAQELGDRVGLALTSFFSSC